MQSMDDIAFQTEVLANLLGNLAEEDRPMRLRQSLQWLESGGLDPTSVRTIELRVCERLGLPISNPLERLPHIFVNLVREGAQGVKLGFMNRDGAEQAVKTQAEKIRERLERRGCEVSRAVFAPDPDENFFWFRVAERDEPPTIRELLESYGDVIVR
jgi:hypothetical protein